MTQRTGMVQPPIRNVFIADDDTSDLHFMQHALKAADPTLWIELLRNSEELFYVLSHLKPDLLFLDLEMPCHKGRECLKLIRDDEKLADMPIIVFSRSTRPANITAAYELGADLFLIRPFDHETFVTRLQDLLKMDWSQPQRIKESFTARGNYKAFV